MNTDEYGNLSVSFKINGKDAVKLYSCIIWPYVDDLVGHYEQILQNRGKTPRKKKNKVNKIWTTKKLKNV